MPTRQDGGKRTGSPGKPGGLSDSEGSEDGITPAGGAGDSSQLKALDTNEEVISDRVTNVEVGLAELRDSMANISDGIVKHKPPAMNLSRHS